MLIQTLRSVFRRAPAVRHPAQPAVSPDVRTSRDGAGIVFLDLRKGEVFRSNCVGAEIWEGLERHQELPEITSEISRRYGAPESDVAQDAARFVTELEARGLLLRETASQAKK